MKKVIVIFLLLGKLLLADYSIAQQTPSEAKRKPQEVEEGLKQRLVDGAEILNKARKAIYRGVKPRDIKSLYFELNGNFLRKSKVNIHGLPVVLSDSSTRVTTQTKNFTKRFATQDVYFIEFPYKMKTQRLAMVHADDSIYSVDKSEASAATEIFNKNKHAAEITILTGGKKYDIDDPNLDRAVKLNNIPHFNKNPRSAIKTFSWREIFPIILTSYQDKNVKFEYVGKAEAPDGRRADIVELKTDTSASKIRLFFDEKTHLLLMTTFEDVIKRNVKKGGKYDGFVETKSTYYFSGHEVIDGLLIPKKINMAATSKSEYENQKVYIESDKETITAKVNNFDTDTREMEVEAFMINPIFEKDTFVKLRVRNPRK